jgi:hypothetical protein
MQNSKFKNGMKDGSDITNDNAMCHYIKSTYGQNMEMIQTKNQFVRVIYSKEYV